MLIATWNINNRVGLVPFRPEVASVTAALNPDVIVFNEYYPKEHEAQFTNALRTGGWEHQQMSPDTGVRANRVLIASKVPLEQAKVQPPQFDRQFPANVLCVRVPAEKLTILGVRIPWYDRGDLPLVGKAWDWLEAAASQLREEPAVILGDLNAGLSSRSNRGGEHLRRILASGWTRAAPCDHTSFYGSSGETSEIDHILVSQHVGFHSARYVTQAGQFQIAGPPNAMSDHCVLLAHVGGRRS